VSKSKEVVVHERRSVSAVEVDPFFVRVTYRARESSFKWRAVCYRTTTRTRTIHLPYEPWYEEQVVSDDKEVDHYIFATRRGAISWAKRTLRRERNFAKNGVPDKSFEVR
jgi:hypothetical protein